MPQTALKLFSGFSLGNCPVTFQEWGILSAQALVLKDGFLSPVLSVPSSNLKLR